MSYVHQCLEFEMEVDIVQSTRPVQKNPSQTPDRSKLAS